MTELIISQPSLQTLRQRFASSILTFLFWAFWIYLWLPLVSLLAWLFGIDLFYEQLIVQSSYNDLIHIASWYLFVILMITVSLISWSVYNLFRFRNKDRRRHTVQVGLSEIAAHFSVDDQQLAHWHDAKRIVIRHDEQGNIHETESSSGAA